MEKGAPEKEIAFIHDANTEIRKAELFAKVRSGQVRFLLGSTQKMGAGTNVHEYRAERKPVRLSERISCMKEKAEMENAGRGEIAGKIKREEIG